MCGLSFKIFKWFDFETVNLNQTIVHCYTHVNVIAYGQVQNNWITIFAHLCDISNKENDYCFSQVGILSEVCEINITTRRPQCRL